MLAPVLMSGIRRATSLVCPSVARYSTSVSQPDISGRLSPSFRRLHPTSSLATPSLFRVSRRLFSSQAPEHHSRTIYHPIEDWTYVFKDTALKSGVKAIPETKEIEDIELVANRNPGIREFIERIDVNNLPAEVRDRYVRAIHYYNTTIVDIEEKGKEMGIEIGKKEGLLKAAFAMKSFGIPDDKIAEKLGLNQQEMESLKMPVN